MTRLSEPTSSLALSFGSPFGGFSRLTKCTVGAQAVATQPLPFRCPMDHVLPIGAWHGQGGARRRRGKRCALPARADGGPDEGMPYRTHGWLRVAARQSHLAFQGTRSATLVPGLVPKLVPSNSSSHTGALNVSVPRGFVGYARSSSSLPPDVPLHGADQLSGPAVPLPMRSTEAQVQRLAQSHRILARSPLLRVTLGDASKLLGKYKNT